MTHLAKQRFANMILGLLLFAAAAPISLCADDSGLGADGSESVAGRNARMKWWREARFGMFIHWNVSSVPAGVYHGKHNHFVGEWLMHDEKIPVAEYKEYARQFNPVKFNADEWVLLAKQAGMKYIVFTAKHHDGMAMYHSDVSDWNIVDATPFKRDVLKELSEACRKYGIKLGVYYSHAADWTHPGGRVPAGCWDEAQVGDFDGYLRTVAAPQVREILTRYGPIATMWWDASWDMNKPRADMLKSLLRLQKDILMNDRLGGDYQGDFGTPEQSVPDRGTSGRDWETCMTINDTWGYKVNDDNWKSSETLIRFLADAVSKGGNYLLNVGPTEAGLFPEKSVERLRRIGDWMKRNGEAIYGAGVAPVDQPAWGRCTQKRDKNGLALYLLVFTWPTEGQLALTGVLPGEVEKAYMLSDSGKHSLKFFSTNSITTIGVPIAAPEEVCPVIVLRIKSNPPVPAVASDRTAAASKAEEPEATPVESIRGKRPAAMPEAAWLPPGRLYAQQRLNLSRSEATDETLTHLGELRGLSRLDLAYLKISDAGMGNLKALKSLNMLTLTGSPITDAGLTPLMTVPDLGVLVLNDTLITDDGAEELGKMSQLGELYLQNTKIGDAGVARLNTELVRLCLGGTGITDSGLQSLKAFRRLTDLDLSRTAISDAGLQNLSALLNLRVLDLTDTGITDAGLIHLRRLTKLQGLRLASAKVTDAGVAELKKYLPDLTVHR